MNRAAEIVEIVNTINLYAIAVDTQTWDLFDQVFTDHIAIDFGGPAAWENLAALKQAFEAIHSPFDSTLHVTTNHHVAFDAEGASCMSYVHGRFVRAVPEGGNMFESEGWYEDRLVQTPQGWRIAKRHCLSQWWGGNPVVLAAAEGMTVEPKMDSLKVEAAQGRVPHVKIAGN